MEQWICAVPANNTVQPLHSLSLHMINTEDYEYASGIIIK